VLPRLESLLAHARASEAPPATVGRPGPCAPTRVAAAAAAGGASHELHTDARRRAAASEGSTLEDRLSGVEAEWLRATFPARWVLEPHSAA
jgi:hypothetical protein